MVVVVAWWTAAENQRTLRARLAPAVTARSLSCGERRHKNELGSLELISRIYQNICQSFSSIFL
jgi:hypothetical protein